MDLKAVAERLMRFLCSVQEPYYSLLKRLGNFWLLFRNRERVVHLGPLHPDKTFYVIRDLPAYAGLGSWYDRVLGYLERAERRGWIPVVEPQPPAQADDGAWDVFFDGPSTVPLEEVLQSQNVVFAVTHAVIHKRYNPRQIDIRHRLGIKIKLSEAASQFVDARLPMIFADAPSRMIGVMFRGTDYRRHGEYCPVGHAKVPSVRFFCDRIESDLRQWNVPVGKGERLFVVTEEQEALDEIKSRFPKCRFVVKERYENFKFGKWLAYQRLPHTTPKENNFLYLLDILALARCDCLIDGMNGCVLMALNLNGNRYSHVDVLDTGIN